MEYPLNARGAMFIPVIVGSDKTTVSVGTGSQAFHPVYQSPGCISNTARRAHGNGMLPVGFLPIPKGVSILGWSVISQFQADRNLVQ